VRDGVADDSERFHFLRETKKISHSTARFGAGTNFPPGRGVPTHG